MGVDSSGNNRELLYGILAWRTGLLTRQALIDGLDAWVHDRGRPLSAVLIERGDLDEAAHLAIDRLVAQHLARRSRQ
ncbi:MAG: hypothetical protein AB7I30_04980, partial [Isosphaeraceae bacterium]